MDGLGGAREWEEGTGRTEGDTEGMVLVPGDRERGSAKPVGGRDLTLGQPGKRECQPRRASQGSRTSRRRVRRPAALCLSTRGSRRSWEELGDRSGAPGQRRQEGPRLHL